MSGKWYINYYPIKKGPWERETVSECDTAKEAHEELSNYAFSDPQGYYYVSRRACGNWKEAQHVR